MVKHTWTVENINFIKNNFDKYPNFLELRTAFNNHFKLNLSDDAFRRKSQTLGFGADRRKTHPAGTGTYQNSDGKHIWTDQQLQFLKDTFPSVDTVEQLRKVFNRTFNTEVKENQVLSRCRSLDLRFSDKEKQKRKGIIVMPPDIHEDILKDELREVKEENRFLLKEVEKLSKVSSLDERILSKFDDVCTRYEKIKIITPRKFKYDHNKTTEDALLCLADSHLEEVVNREEMMDINEYSVKIFAKRMQNLADKTISILKHNMSGFNFQRLNIAFLGDMITGAIHEELRATNEVPCLEAVVVGSNVFSQFLIELAQHFDLRVWGVAGNHTRMTEKRSFKQKYNSLDWILYQMIQRTVSHIPNIKCEFSKSLFEIKEIQGQNYKFSHGDEIKGGQGGIPFYGIFRTDDRLTGTLLSKDVTFNSAFIGHFHSDAHVPRKSKGSVWMCGSAIGSTEYSLGSMGISSPASQFLCGIHHKFGVVHPFNVNIQDANKIISDKDLRYNYRIE